MVFKYGTSVAHGWRKKEPYKTRIEVLNEIRNEIRRHHEFMVHRCVQDPKQAATDVKFNLGDLVLIQWNPRQHRIMSHHEGSSKLVSNWSLPMRVVSTNVKGTLATVRCLTTRYVQRIHVSRCRFIQKPPKDSELYKQWEIICKNECPLVTKLMKSSSGNKLGK